MSFETNPLNDDLVSLTDTGAIARSIRNIVFTSPGEKFFNPDFGSKLYSILFENIDDISAIKIKDQIEQSIKNFEPRVDLVEVEVFPDFDNNGFDVKITYKIIGAEITPQVLQFILQPTR